MIRVLTTGGTIEGCCGAAAMQPRNTIAGMLAEAHYQSGIIVEPLFCKNSRGFTETERLKIFQACKAAPEKLVVITHGTHTLCETARYCGLRHKDLPGKTIVLTGALRHVTNEPALNLGFALAAVQFLPAGVYVSMQGQVFYWNNVVKDENAKPPQFTVAVR